MAGPESDVLMDVPAGLRIEHLAQHASAIPTLAAWAYREWGHLAPGIVPEEIVERYRRRVVPGTIPETFVALYFGRVIGMASIVENDLSLRPDLTPWMASVYVDAPYRNLGVGSRIVRAVVQEAAALEVDRLYLITHDRSSFYGRLGWRQLDRVHYRGEEVSVMSIATGRPYDFDGFANPWGLA